MAKAGTFAQIGEISAEEASELTGGRVTHAVPVAVNKLILDYDQILLLGVSLPHESAGFGGGYKYFFPGISGWDMINFFHWLGASVGTVDAIGQFDTPVRRVINRAGEFIPIPILSFNSVMKGHEWMGLYIGPVIEAHHAACDLLRRFTFNGGSTLHARHLSAQPIVDELWTGKGLYKLQPSGRRGESFVCATPRADSATQGKLSEGCYHVFDT